MVKTKKTHEKLPEKTPDRFHRISSDKHNKLKMIKFLRGIPIKFPNKLSQEPPDNIPDAGNFHRRKNLRNALQKLPMNIMRTRSLRNFHEKTRTILRRTPEKEIQMHFLVKNIQRKIHADEIPEKFAEQIPEKRNPEKKNEATHETNLRALLGLQCR